MANGSLYHGELCEGGECSRAVQVDPIKPTLKAPGSKRLKLRYDEPLSKFAFNFNLRRYSAETALEYLMKSPPKLQQGKAVHVDPIKPELKAPRTQRLKLQCDEPLSRFAFNFNLRR
jgi:hypothetical protein